jgi:choline dehydrogenase-like flavoprotein
VISATSTEVVVAGGGTAGCVVAARLAEAGRDVVMIEAGPDLGPLAGGSWPAELLDAGTIPTSHDWGYGTAFPGRHLAFERAKVIGGCSAHNGCTVSWGHRADYDGWAALGLEGWGADDMLPLFRSASERLRVRRFPPEDWVPFHRGFIEAGPSMGLPVADDLESLEAGPSVGAEPSNSPEGVRWNTAFAYLDPVRGLPNLRISGGVTVGRVLVEGGRAVGVAARGPEGPFEVRANLVVLAGGTYGSPAVLLRSGIGPADELRALGVEPLVDLPGVGRNLHDHPAYEVYVAPSDELERRTAAFAAGGRPVPDEQAMAKLASSRCRGASFDLHVFPERAMDGRMAVFAALLTPRSRGRVALADADPLSAPVIDHAYLSDPEGHDLAALVEGVEAARAFAASAPMARLSAGELEPGPDADLREAVRRGVIHYWHPVGTCAMGSVTDGAGRVRGLEGLAVADASLMPVTVRATTNLPTVVVAERIAGRLASRPSSGW